MLTHILIRDFESLHGVPRYGISCLRTRPCLEFNRSGRQKINNILALIELGFSGKLRPPS